MTRTNHKVSNVVYCSPLRKVSAFFVGPSLGEKKELKSAGGLITERANQFTAALEVLHHFGYIYQVICSDK